MKNYYIFLIINIVTFTNCAQKMDKKEYIELGNHKGTKKHQVKELLSSNFGIYELENKLGKSYIFLDTKNNNLIVDCTEHLKNKNIYNIAVFSNNGKHQENYENDDYKLLSDGTLWADDHYSNALINGSNNKELYIDPFSNKKIEDIFNLKVQIKLEDWFKKFKELYKKADKIHLYKATGSDYFFKINQKWYYIEAFHKAKELKIDIEKEYPEKSNENRMIPLEKEKLKFYIPPQERKNKILEEIAYESKHFEKVNYGLVSSGYSAGWWYLHVNMPNEAIKIKRFASYKKPAINVFKIPKEFGGNDNVLFLVLETNSMHEQQKGGLFVIRQK